MLWLVPWNVAFEFVFLFQIPRETTIIGYADVMLVVVEDDSLGVMQARENATLETVANTMVVKDAPRGSGLLDTPGDEAVQLGTSLKYLGIVLERKRTMFWAHLRAAAKKAQRVIGAFGKLMSNVSHPRENRRRLSCRQRRPLGVVVRRSDMDSFGVL